MLDVIGYVICDMFFISRKIILHSNHINERICNEIFHYVLLSILRNADLKILAIPLVVITRNAYYIISTDILFESHYPLNKY